MRTLYFDCSMGASGDMLMAALYELHNEPEGFLERLNSALGGLARVTAAKDQKCGISCTHISVTVNGVEESEHMFESGHTEHHAHHSCGDAAEIFERIAALPASEKIKAEVREVFGVILEAESRVHGQSLENVHLHELGSIDAFADILGVCMLIDEIAPEIILASHINVGSGTVKCAHGVMSVPAPATSLILNGIPIYSDEIKAELCTPTGAALLKHFAEDFIPLPQIKVEAIGYGSGSRNFERANVLRVFLGETEPQEEKRSELSCNLDDMTPEAIGFLQEELFKAGALDVYTVNIGMKKCRPGIMLSCICGEDKKDEMVRTIFKNSTTLGIRETECRRYVLKRQSRTVETEFGSVRIKSAEGFGVKREKAEYEDLASIARKTGKSLSEISEIVKKADATK